MDAKEFLLGALRFYGITVNGQSGNRVNTIKGYAVEIEANGLYKLFSDGQVVAPFDDVDELCRFILV